jgi:phage head maturation protease
VPDSFQVSGLACTWRIFPSGNWPGEFERFSPGCFAEVLRSGATVRLFINHEPGRELARTADGSLRFWIDGPGLGYRATVARAGPGLALWDACRAGQVRGHSLGWGRLGPADLTRTTARTIRNPVAGVRQGILHEHTRLSLEEISVLIDPTRPAGRGTLQSFRFEEP